MAKPIKIESDAPPANRTSYDFILLDKSGSMNIVRDQTIQGINNYISTLKANAKQLNAKVLVSVMLFDSTLNTVLKNQPVTEIPEFTRDTYRPNGGTALADAVGEAVAQLRTELAGREGSDEVDVTVTIFTDGQEYDSKKYTMSQVTGMIQELKDQFNWTFSFVGQGSREEVVAQAQTFGIAASNAVSYSHGQSDTAFAAMNTARSAKLASYSSVGAKSAVGYFVPENNVNSGTDASKLPEPPRSIS